MLPPALSWDRGSSQNSFPANGSGVPAAMVAAVPANVLVLTYRKPAPNDRSGKSSQALIANVSEVKCHCRVHAGVRPLNFFRSAGVAMAILTTLLLRLAPVPFLDWTYNTKQSISGM